MANSRGFPEIDYAAFLKLSQMAMGAVTEERLRHLKTGLDDHHHHHEHKHEKEAEHGHHHENEDDHKHESGHDHSHSHGDHKHEHEHPKDDDELEVQGEECDAGEKEALKYNLGAVKDNFDFKASIELCFIRCTRNKDSTSIKSFMCRSELSEAIVRMATMIFYP